MDPILKKLQIKPETSFAVLRRPVELAEAIEAWGSEVTLTSRPSKKSGAVLAFVRSCREIAELAPKLVQKLEGDALLWLAYPKKSSKRYGSDIGRDDSWQALGALGFESVRQIALDADWSALRFRRAENIKTMKRSAEHAISAEGKRRVREKKA